jgi:NADH:ubiquinone oxidoreductase subunit 6 (subunit J)
MKSHCLYFGYAFAVITIICFWVAIGLRSVGHGILAIALSLFTIALFMQYRKDIQDDNR